MESLLRRRAAYAAFTLLLAATAAVGGFDRLTAQAQVRSRWLEIRRMSGQVTYQRSSSRSASLGDRLQAPGHSVRTGRGASAVLALDDGVGIVNALEILAAFPGPKGLEVKMMTMMVLAKTGHSIRERLSNVVYSSAHFWSNLVYIVGTIVPDR